MEKRLTRGRWQRRRSRESDRSKVSKLTWRAKENTINKTTGDWMWELVIPEGAAESVLAGSRGGKSYQKWEEDGQKRFVLHLSLNMNSSILMYWDVSALILNSTLHSPLFIQHISFIDMQSKIKKQRQKVHKILILLYVCFKAIVEQTLQLWRNSTSA